MLAVGFVAVVVVVVVVVVFIVVAAVAVAVAAAVAVAVAGVEDEVEEEKVECEGEKDVGAAFAVVGEVREEENGVVDGGVEIGVELGGVRVESDKGVAGGPAPFACARGGIPRGGSRAVVAVDGAGDGGSDGGGGGRGGAGRGGVRNATGAVDGPGSTGR